MPGNSALIVAAGRGRRVGNSCPKQYLSLAGKPLLRHAVEALLSWGSAGGRPGRSRIEHLQIVIDPEQRAFYDAALSGLDLPEPVAGGANRQESVRCGLEALVRQAPDCVFIHDAARPYVSAATLDRLLAALREAPGAIPVVPVMDSLKRSADGRILGALPRDGTVRAQTPQAFRFSAILDAHRVHAGSDLGDDAAVAEAFGLTVAAVPGDAHNVKVTTAEDFILMEALMAPAAMVQRCGQGFDVHAFGGSGPLRLCGIDVPHERGLAGHSDADVGLHALTDALLGALAEGDIGTHFPPSEERWKGADSQHFLEHASALLQGRGGRLCNLDLTIVCEAPKIGPYRAQMRARIAEILKVDCGAVSVKATTTEGLGFAGRGEGIAAQAVVSIALPAQPHEPVASMSPAPMFSGRES